jgi:hypothetical protein
MLPSGSVPPSFLSVVGASAKGHENRFENYSIKVGTVVKIHAIDAKTNISKSVVEYDVVALEQDQNSGSVYQTFRNCEIADGLGGIGDYLEKTFRPQTKKKKNQKTIDNIDQDGAQVLIACLNGASEKAIILSAIKHAARKTKLTGKGPQMFGSFNGIDIQVETDGSCRLTFNGATDNEGKPLDPKQGITTVDIEKDGSVQIKNAGVVQRLQKDGKLIVSAEDAVTLSNKKAFTIQSEDKDSKKKVTLKADDGKLSIDAVSAALKASGSATMDFGSLKISSEGEALLKAQSLNIEASSMVKAKAANIVLDGMVALGGEGGTPAVTMQTISLGVGNLGIPVLSQFIGPFSSKVTIV